MNECRAVGRERGGRERNPFDFAAFRLVKSALTHFILRFRGRKKILSTREEEGHFGRDRNASVWTLFICPPPIRHEQVPQPTLFFRTRRFSTPVICSHQMDLSSLRQDKGNYF